jgi:hypothetical protein
MEGSSATQQPTHHHWTLPDPDQTIHKQIQECDIYVSVCLTGIEMTNASRSALRPIQLIQWAQTVLRLKSEADHSAPRSMNKKGEALRHSPKTPYLHSAYKGNFYHCIYRVIFACHFPQQRNCILHCQSMVHFI